MVNPMHIDRDKTNPNLNTQPFTIARPPTIGETTSWGNEPVFNGLIGKVAWMIGGFNLGFVIIMATILVILPTLFPELRLRRTNASSDETKMQYTIITNTPTITLPPTETPTLLPTTIVPSPTVDILSTQTAVAQALPTLPSVTPTPFPTETPIPPTPTPLPPPLSYQLQGIKFQKQTWNNCGPANLAMGLSYFNWQGDQTDTASYLKPDREDKNVTPEEMVNYVLRYTSLKAIWRMAGNIDQIKLLMSNGFVVIVESGYEPGSEGWFGHYETIVSYDDSKQTITIYDSYLGAAGRPAVTYAYERFDRQWQSFNRNYIVIYPPEREKTLEALLGSDWAPHLNRQKAVQIAQQEAAQDPTNKFAWVNLGTSLVAIGRYEEAVVAFEKALSLNLPYRMFWYQFAIYEAYLQTGRLDAVMTIADQTLRTTQYLEETYYYKGRVYETRGEYNAALEQYQKALDFNPNYNAAQVAYNRVQGFVN